MAYRVRPILLVMALVGCVGPLTPGPEDADLADADLRVAYVGNSLTDTENIPGLVQAMATAAGRSMSHVTITAPNASLEDHWYRGTADVLKELEPDVVVLQQGPSSLPSSRDHLIHWTRQFEGVIREVGGEPALFMVWPSLARKEVFGDVWTSYRMAADTVDGLFIPAGQTWVEAWELDPTLELYGPDDFHPGYLGALAAAQTIYASLYGLDADSVPALEDGVAPATVATLREALARSLDPAGSPTAPRLP